MDIAQLPLDRYRERGNCGGGSHGGVKILDSSVFDHFEQDYNDCDGEGCVSADDVDDYRENVGLTTDDPLDMELCPLRNVTATRYVWNGGDTELDETPRDDEPEALPTDFDY